MRERQVYAIASTGDVMLYAGAFENSQVWVTHPPLALFYDTRSLAACVCEKLQRDGYRCYVADVTLIEFSGSD